jgi:hypothetical protein
MDLKNLNVQEMNKSEMVEIEGGVLWIPLIALGILLASSGTLH